MLIAIAGGDGAGKSLVARALVRELATRAMPARCIRPLDGAGVLDVDRVLLPGCLAAMPPVPRVLFLMSSMAAAVSQARTAAPDCIIALVDGYWMKHAAAEIARGMDSRWIEAVVSALPDPDLVLYLRVEPDVAWARKQGAVVPYECGTDTSCSREAFVAHQGRIVSRLDAWAAASGWIVIHAARTPAAVVADALDPIVARWSARARSAPGIRPPSPACSS